MTQPQNFKSPYIKAIIYYQKCHIYVNSISSTPLCILDNVHTSTVLFIVAASAVPYPHAEVSRLSSQIQNTVKHRMTLLGSLSGPGYKPPQPDVSQLCTLRRLPGSQWRPFFLVSILSSCGTYLHKPGRSHIAKLSSLLQEAEPQIFINNVISRRRQDRAKLD